MSVRMHAKDYVGQPHHVNTHKNHFVGPMWKFLHAHVKIAFKDNSSLCNGKTFAIQVKKGLVLGML